MKTKTVFDLEERLINFAVSIHQTVEKLPKTEAARYLGGQLIRSGTSPALNYAEAQAAESKNDFLHKMKLCLKELRESHVNLKIIQRNPTLPGNEITDVLDECSQLVAIFVKSIQSASNNNRPRR